jgi:hypothetical protein
VSADDLALLKAMPYERYLQTGHWRWTRNQALQRVGFRCEKCRVGRNLQVHHLTYERLGEELFADLEVVCRGCHLGLHVHELNQGLGVYFKLISDVLEHDNPTGLDDLLELVKVRCARARIPYNNDRLHIAVGTLDREHRLRFVEPLKKKYGELLDRGHGTQPLTHAEACGLIAQFSAQGLLKPMPTVKAMTQRQADKRIVVRQIAALVVDCAHRCDELEQQTAAVEAAAVTP